MDDWQGSLNPLCQLALKKAQECVLARDGVVVTVEDFLLSMIEHHHEFRAFLRSRGVELDELTRAIQGEQPIVSGIGQDDMLSWQLIEWFVTARERSPKGWLDWRQLMMVLVSGIERFRGKSYLPILECVGEWERDGGEVIPLLSEQPPSDHRPQTTVVDASWVRFSEWLAVSLATSSRTLHWVRGPRGCGKTAWLERFMPTLSGGYLALDIRREADILASPQEALPWPRSRERRLPTLILDNVSPSDLHALIHLEFGVARTLMLGYEGPILLLGPESKDCQKKLQQIGKLLGRPVRIEDFPQSSVSQRQAVLLVHQPFIEKRWGIELPLETLDYAAGHRNPLVAQPGTMLEWIERASARLYRTIERDGPAEQLAVEEFRRLTDRWTLQWLSRLQDPQFATPPVMDKQAEDIAAAASDIHWQERKRNQALFRLSIEDLRAELEHWVAAQNSSVHY